MPERLGQKLAALVVGDEVGQHLARSRRLVRRAESIEMPDC